MSYGMYLSASAVMVHSHRMDVFSNNMANVNTPGFKPQMAGVQQRLPEQVENGHNPQLSQRMLEQLGGGVYAASHQTMFDTSTLISSDRSLDVAMTQDNAFFAVENVNSTSGETEVMLTRNGRFDIKQGELVTSTGHRVLDDRDKPIKIPEGYTPYFNTLGEIEFRNNSDEVLDGPRLQVARADTDKLEHRGKNLLAMIGGDSRQAIDIPDLKPGHYEASGTDPIKTMMQIVAATKAATGNANMIRYHDQMMNQSINTFGRVA